MFTGSFLHLLSTHVGTTSTNSCDSFLHRSFELVCRLSAPWGFTPAIFKTPKGVRLLTSRGKERLSRRSQSRSCQVLFDGFVRTTRAGGETRTAVPTSGREDSNTEVRMRIIGSSMSTSRREKGQNPRNRKSRLAAYEPVHSDGKGLKNQAQRTHSV